MFLAFVQKVRPLLPIDVDAKISHFRPNLASRTLTRSLGGRSKIWTANAKTPEMWHEMWPRDPLEPFQGIITRWVINV
jgi:hypothetical protein